MDKGVIWEILNKYDRDKTKREFCDSLSLILQGFITEDSIFTILRETTNIPQFDCEILDRNIGLSYRIF